MALQYAAYSLHLMITKVVILVNFFATTTESQCPDYCLCRNDYEMICQSSLMDTFPIVNTTAAKVTNL